MSRFYIADKKLQMSKADGELTAEEATAFALIQISEIADDIDTRLRGIEWVLTEGEIKVHRTQ